MNIRHLNSVQDIGLSRWRALLDQQSQKNPFQSPEYVDLIKAKEGMDAAVFALEVDAELVALGVVTILYEKSWKSFFSRRGIIYGGLLAKDTAGDHLLDLLRYMTAELSSKLIYLELRSYFDDTAFRDIFVNSGLEHQPHLNIQIPLRGKTTDVVMQNMSLNRRRQIATSIELGTVWKELTSVEDISLYYNIQRNFYSTTLKLPLPNLDYFISLGTSSIGKVFGVFHQGRIIGGSACLYYPKGGIYTQYYCGLRDYHKKIFPSHLAIWAAIEFGLNHHLTHLDMVGAGRPGEEYGVRDYKERFGGELLEQGRYLKILHPLLYHIGKWGVRMLQTMK